MGLRFPTAIMPLAYRGFFACYRHKARFLHEQDSKTTMVQLGTVATMPEAWSKRISRYDNSDRK